MSTEDIVDGSGHGNIDVGFNPIQPTTSFLRALGFEHPEFW